MDVGNGWQWAPSCVASRLEHGRRQTLAGFGRIWSDLAGFGGEVISDETAGLHRYSGCQAIHRARLSSA
jgi:hypothetical protein